MLLAGFGGRADLLKHVVEVFLEDAPAILARIKEALHAGNGTEVAAAAHSLKGSVGLFSQGEAFEGGTPAGADRTKRRPLSPRPAREVEDSVARLTTELRAVSLEGTVSLTS